MNDKLDRFTKRAKRALTLAQEEAMRLNHTYIGTEHLLLGLVREENGMAAKVLRALEVEPGEVIRAVERTVGGGERKPFGKADKPSLAPRTKRVIELAVDEARLMSHYYIGTEHLLLGLVRDGEGIAIKVLRGLGVNLDKVRTQVAREILASTTKESSAPPFGDTLTASPPVARSTQPHGMQLQLSTKLYDNIAALIQSYTQHRPTVGLILGTGLGSLAEEIENADIIPYAEIPLFPTSTVASHAGRLVIGELEGVTVCAMQGRFHFYEGYTMQEITLPVRVMQRLGVQTLIVTNAAGGVNSDFETGDLMLMEDHINFIGMAGNNPLIGPNLDDFGPRFPAANRIYTRELRDLARRVADEQGLTLRRGVYAALAGPNFETPAEIRFLRVIGADAVGMSTAHEALVAHHAGMQVLAISTITNTTVDVVDADEEPDHEGITAAGKVIVPKLTALVRGVLGKMGDGNW